MRAFLVALASLTLTRSGTLLHRYLLAPTRFLSLSFLLANRAYQTPISRVSISPIRTILYFHRALSCCKYICYIHSVALPPERDTSISFRPLAFSRSLFPGAFVSLLLTRNAVSPSCSLSLLCRRLSQSPLLSFSFARSFSPPPLALLALELSTPPLSLFLSRRCSSARNAEMGKHNYRRDSDDDDYPTTAGG